MRSVEYMRRTAGGSTRGPALGWRRAFAGSLVVLSTAFFTPAAIAQNAGRVIGQVVEAGTGAPLSQVQVHMPGTGLGTLTRQDGRFIVLNVPPGTYEVRAQRIDLAPVSQEVVVTAGQVAEVSFQMETQALGLDEIVVTGTAGASRQREVGNSIAQIDVAQLPGRPTRVTNMLQSAAPGIDVMAAGGSLGQGKVIRLRGNSSVSMSNQPLIYVDGVRMMSEAFPQTAGADYRAGRGANMTASPLDNINPNDIERIEVIKGSAATTLYGTEASAGVIQIFTKRGVAGAPVWTVETQQGTSWSRKFGTEEVPYLFMDPWLRNGHEQQYFASVRGGGQDLQYFASGQFNNATGILPLDELDKWVVRGNFTFTPAEDLQLQWNSAYSNQWQKNTPVGNNSQGLTLNAFRQERNYFGKKDPEVISQVLDYDLQQQIERFTTGGTVTYSPLPNLTNRLTIGYDHSQQEARNLRPFGFIAFPQGGLLNSTWQKRLLTFDYVGTFSFDLSDALRSNFSWGGQAVGDDERLVEAWGEGFPGAEEPTVDNAAETLGFEEREKVWNAGFFFQNVFDLQNRYFVTVGLRVDGNSAFGEGFGLQMYPKASASWVISDEGWWQDEWGTIKLRAAYGKAGRAPGVFDAARTWQSAALAGQPAFVPDNVGNPDLGPEVTGEFETGFDAAWLDDRIRSTFTYYRQVTEDALLDVTQIPSLGFTEDQLLNVGTLENKGMEIALDVSPIRSADWGWDVGVNVSTNHSEVLDLGGAPEFEAAGGWIIEGQPVPVNRADFITNPDEIADPIIVEDSVVGPELPTLMVSGRTTVRLPYGISVSAVGEFRGGNVLEVNPISIDRSVRSPLCYPYYVDPQSSIELKEGIPALWRARCTPAIDAGYWYDAGYFKLRTVSAMIPLDVLFPAQFSSSTLTLTLNNSYLWMKDIPWMDPEMLGNEGARSAGLGATERVPTPISLRASLRVTF